MLTGILLVFVSGPYKLPWLIVANCKGARAHLGGIVLTNDLLKELPSSGLLLSVHCAFKPRVVKFL